MEKKWRQRLHLEPPQGWLNDPNGLCYFKGKYHVYFQYSPDGVCGEGKKCWGHYQSSDFLHWEYTGIVLVSDIPEDRNGVYSGCAFVTDDRMEIFYTGNVKEKGDYDYITAGREANVIYVYTEDGCVMSEKNVLLRNQDYPENCSCHVRDPKVWREDDGYRMVLGARTLDDRGEVLFYRSDDLTSWSFEKEVSIPDFGYMWECPDCFTIDGHRYLSISPQGLPQEEFRYQNIYSSGYFRYDGNQLTDFEEWDYGFDFYAPQTFEAPDGRRILIGWMGIGDIPYTNPTVELGWQHCLTLPREVTIAADGGLRQSPIRELEDLRGEKRMFSAGETIEVSLPFDLNAQIEEEFCLQLSGCEISFREGVLTVRFTDESTGSARTVRRARLDQCRNMRMIADMSSLEIYINDGRTVFSTRYYPAGEKIKLAAEGLSCEIYKLKSMKFH